jgi:hypothetical protein
MQPLPHRQHRAEFEDLVTQALDHAKSLGATDAAAEVSAGQGLAVNVRLGEIETVEQTSDRSLSITVFAGHAGALPRRQTFLARPLSKPCKRRGTLRGLPLKIRRLACRKKVTCC